MWKENARSNLARHMETHASEDMNASVNSESYCPQKEHSSSCDCTSKTLESSSGVNLSHFKTDSGTGPNVQSVFLSFPVSPNAESRPNEDEQRYSLSYENNVCLTSFFSLSSKTLTSEGDNMENTASYHVPVNIIDKSCDEFESRVNISESLFTMSLYEQESCFEDQESESIFSLNSENIEETNTVPFNFSNDFSQKENGFCLSQSNSSSNVQVDRIFSQSAAESQSPRVKKISHFWGATTLNWILVFYFLILVTVASICVITPFYVAQNTVAEAAKELHRYIRLEMNSHLHSAADIPYTLSEVLTGLYIKNQTQPSTNDDVVPMDFTMTQRLCAIIGKVDRLRLLTMVYYASVSRNEIAFCTRLYHDQLFGTFDMTFDNNSVFNILAVDPATIKRIEPPKVLASMKSPVTLNELVNNISCTGEILNEWKEAVDAGRTPHAKLWNIDYFLLKSFVYTHPFIEKDNTVSFMKVGLDFTKLMDYMFFRQSHLKRSMRIMFLEYSQGATNILANNWHQPVVEVEPLPSCGLRHQSVSSPTLHEISDELMHAVVSHLDLKDVVQRLSQNDPFFFAFAPYKGHSKGAAVSVILIYSNSGSSVFALVTSPVNQMRRLQFSRSITSVVLALSIAWMWVLAYVVIVFCVRHPLRRIAEELRAAAIGSSLSGKMKTPSLSSRVSQRINSTKCGEVSSMLIEVHRAQKACFSLCNQLDEVRSFLPQVIFEGKHYCPTKLFDLLPQNSFTARGFAKSSGYEGKRNSKSVSSSVVKFVDGDLTLPSTLPVSKKNFACCPDINIFRKVSCAVVSIHITDLEIIVEHGDAMAKIIACAAQKYGGCIDIFSAELFNVTFGCLWRVQDKEFYAIQLAMEIDHNLPAALRSCCVIVVDSGMYYFGVCGHPVRREVVVFGRSITSEALYTLRRYGVTVAFLEPAVQYISPHIHVLPVLEMRRSSVIVDYFKPQQRPPHGMLIYSPIKGMRGNDKWQEVDALYRTGFTQFYRGECAEAIQCFESLATQPHISSDLKQFLRHQIHLVQSSFRESMRPCVRGLEPTPKATTSLDVSREGSERVDEPNLQSCDESVVAVGMTRTISNSHLQLQSVDLRPSVFKRDTHEMEYGSVKSSFSLRTQHSSSGVSAVTLPHECWDRHMVHWTRAAEGFPESSCFPVFLGISDTGTLAALKVFPLSLLSVLGYSEIGALETDWSRGGTLYHENIVQILGHARAKGNALLIMEYVPGGTLRDCIARYGRVIPPPAIRRCLVCTLRALEYLHGRGFVHGDVRPENIMMGVEGRYKLTGMDTLRVKQEQDQESAEKSRGPPMYRSPELLATGKFSEASDIFAVGLVLLETAKNQTPWRWRDSSVMIQTMHNDSMAGDEDNMRVQVGRRSKLELMAVLSDVERMGIAVADNMIEVAKDPPGQCISDPLLNEVIDCCLEYNPVDRPSASKLLQMLSDMP